MYSLLLSPELTPPVVRNSGKSVSNLTSACAIFSKFEFTSTAFNYK